MTKFFTYIICIGLLLSANAFAKDEKYTVEIRVDVSDENASIAREKALNSATRAAVNAVAKRLSTSDGASKIATMNDAQIINFIKETSVINEKNSDIRYIADLKIVVNEELLKEYMKEREIPIISQKTENVLVIPVFKEFTDDYPILWESNNLWKQAWDNTTSSSAIKFLSISENPIYQSMIDAKQAYDFDYIAIENIASKAKINNIYVLTASYNGVEGLKIIGKSLSGSKFEINVDGTKSSGMKLFNQAVLQTKSQIESDILLNKDDTPTSQNEITILYHFPNLKYWISTEQKLKKINEITNIHIQAMTPGKAQFKITYTGDLIALQSQLKNLGYNVKNNETHIIMSDIGEE